MNKVLESYLYSHPLFSYSELKQALPAYNGREGALKNVLQYHLKQGNIARIKQSLYVLVPKGSKVPYVDPFLVASKLTDDAVIAYQSALDFYGYLHSARFEFVFLTHKNIAEAVLRFGDYAFRRSKVPVVLSRKNQTEFEIQDHVRFGQTIRVTSAERAFVDVLDRPGLFAYDWEEIAQSLRKVYLGRPSVIVDYLKILESPVTASRVGYFIERSAKKYAVAQTILDQIHDLKARHITYLDPNSTHGNILVKEWNLMVPLTLHHSTWEEKHADI